MNILSTDNYLQKLNLDSKKSLDISLSVVNSTSRTIQLQWNWHDVPNSFLIGYDSVDPYVQQYASVYRKTGNSPFVKIDEVPYYRERYANQKSQIYIDTNNLVPDTTYQYYITIHDPFSFAEYTSKKITAKTQPAVNITTKLDLKEIVRPSQIKLYAPSIRPKKVSLRWNDPFQSQNLEDIKYEVWRSENGTEFYLIDEIHANSPFYVDADLQPNTTYYYLVRANNGKEYSNFSNIVKIKTMEVLQKPPIPTNFRLVDYVIYEPDPDPDTHKLTLEFMWDYPYKNVSFDIWHSPTSNPSDYQQAAFITPGTTYGWKTINGEHVDTFAKNRAIISWHKFTPNIFFKVNTTYYYKIRAFFNNIYSDFSNPITIHIKDSGYNE